MANQEHLEILRSGVSAWNEWKEKNPEVRVDLSGADLRWEDLRWANFSKVNLSEANLREANLSRAILWGTVLWKAILARTNLERAKLREAKLNEADLSRAIIREGDLSKAALKRIDFTGADLSKAYLQKVYLDGANLTTANLIEANLSDSYLVLADFTKANLNRAILRGVNLNRARLDKANLSEAKIIKANLSEVSLDETDFSEAIMEYNVFGNVNLQKGIGLETVKHTGPSYIDTHTLYLSVGSYACNTFFRETGVPPYLIHRIEETKNPVRCLYSADEIADEINNTKELIKKYRKNIAIVEENMAIKGPVRDVFDVHQLDAYKDKVKGLETKLVEFRQHQEENCPICTLRRKQAN